MPASAGQIKVPRVTWSRAEWTKCNNVAKITLGNTKRLRIFDISNKLTKTKKMSKLKFENVTKKCAIIATSKLDYSRFLAVFDSREDADEYIERKMPYIVVDLVKNTQQAGSELIYVWRLYGKVEFSGVYFELITF